MFACVFKRKERSIDFQCGIKSIYVIDGWYQVVTEFSGFIYFSTGKNQDNRK